MSNDNDSSFKNPNYLRANKQFLSSFNELKSSSKSNSVERVSYVVFLGLAIWVGYQMW